MLIDNRHENLSRSLHTIIEDLQLTVNNLTKRIGYMDDKFETFEQRQLEIVARVNGNEQQIKVLSDEITAEISLIESEAKENITSLSSSVTEVSSKVINIETNITSLITIDAQMNQAIFNFTFGDANIGLWNMGGKFPNRKVKFLFSLT